MAAIQYVIETNFTRPGPYQTENLWLILFKKIRTLKGDKRESAVIDPNQSGNRSPQDVWKEFETLKDSLNTTKSKLDDFNLQEWRKHTGLLHLCGFITKALKKKLNAELCTQAWAKLCTLLCEFDILQSLNNQMCDAEDGILRTLHLCEAPGAFVTCVNHILKTNHPDRKWEWIAATLNPYYEGNSLHNMVDDDCFMKWTLNNWDFGTDFTGDITNVANFRHLMKKYMRSITKPSLVTADGSINCADNPGEQERTVFPLLFWEVLTALNVIKKNGIFIFKMYIPCEKCTIKMLYLVYSCFENVHLTKPGPSKPGNSELYIVCIGFSGTSKEVDDITSKLASVSFSFDTNLYERLLERINPPSEFLVKLLRLSEYFAKQQTNVILENVEMREKIGPLEHKITKTKWLIADLFISKFGLKRIEDCDYVVPSSQSKGDGFNKRSESISYLTGSLSERKSQLGQTWTQQLHESEMLADHTMVNAEFSTSLKRLHWHDYSYTGLPLSEALCLSVGTKVDKCESSKFCISTVLHDLLSASQHSDAYGENSLIKHSNSSGSATLSEVSFAKRRRVVRDNSVEVLDIYWIHKCVTSLGECSSLLLYGFMPSNFVAEFQSLISSSVNIKSCEDFDFKVERESPPLIRFKEDSKLFSLDNNVVSLETADCIVWFFDNTECNEFSRKRLKIKKLISVLARLKPKGSFIMRVRHTFSYFSIGLIYLLSQLFRKFCIFQSPFCSSCDMLKYITFVDYKGPCKDILKHLLQIYFTLKVFDSFHPKIDVLHVVSIKAIISNIFEHYIKDRNVRLARLFTRLILCLNVENCIVDNCLDQLELSVAQEC